MNAPNAVKSLDDIAAANRTFSIIAMDQRNTLRRMFTAVGREGTDEQLREAKVDVARALTPLASGLLSDPTFGVRPSPKPTRSRRRVDCSSPPNRPSATPTTGTAHPPRPGARCAVGARPGRRRAEVLRAVSGRPPGAGARRAGSCGGMRRGLPGDHRRLPQPRHPDRHREPRVRDAGPELHGAERETRSSNRRACSTISTSICSSSSTRDRLRRAVAWPRS